MFKASVHPSLKRGVTKTTWLTGRHSFSFGNYFDQSRRNFGTLVVCNEDDIAPGKGFGMHPHENAEVVTFVIEGALKHEDSMGNSGVIKAGEVQRMSAGSGVAHSEMNASKEEPAWIIQTWVLPEKLDVKPSYEQKKFDPKQRGNKFQLVVSPDGRVGSLKINQTAFYSLIDLDEAKSIEYELFDKENIVFIFLIDGAADCEGKSFEKGDSLEVVDAEKIPLSARKDCRFLIIEVPPA